MTANLRGDEQKHQVEGELAQDNEAVQMMHLRKDWKVGDINLPVM